jgi:thioredoxin 1
VAKITTVVNLTNTNPVITGIKSEEMTFAEIINDDKPVLVDFFATWCGPCQAMSPMLESLAGKVGDKARIIKIERDKNQTLANNQAVKAVPTLILYKKGEPLWRQTGAPSMSELLDVIQKAQ